MLLVRCWNDQIHRKRTCKCKLCNSSPQVKLRKYSRVSTSLLKGYVHKGHLIVAHGFVALSLLSGRWDTEIRIYDNLVGQLPKQIWGWGDGLCHQVKLVLYCCIWLTDQHSDQCKQPPTAETTFLGNTNQYLDRAPGSKKEILKTSQ